MTGFFTSPKVAFGPGAIEQLSALEPQRIAIIRTAAVAPLDGPRRIEEFIRSLGVDLAVHTVRASPPTTAEAESLAADLGPSFDLLVALGGGGLLDLVKGARARLARPDLPVSSWTPLTDFPTAGAPRLVAVPSTAGSGSEMTGSAQLLDPEGETLELTHRALTPEWACLDPSLARSVPAGLAVAHGFEVVAHAVEALGAEGASPFSDAMARDALSVAVTALPRLARQPHDAEARSSLYYAAARGGLATSNASLGLAHAMARSLVPEVPKVGYAALLAIVLPATVDYNFPSARDRYESVVPAFPAPTGAVTSGFAERIRAFARTLGLATELRAVGFDEEALHQRITVLVERARRATATVANPRIPTAGEMGRLFELAVGSSPGGSG